MLNRPAAVGQCTQCAFQVGVLNALPVFARTTFCTFSMPSSGLRVSGSLLPVRI